MSKTISRKSFLNAFYTKTDKKNNNYLPLRLQTPTTGLAPYTGTFGKRELLHLLRKTCIGSKYEHVNTYQSFTLTQIIDVLFSSNVQNIGFPLNNYSNADPDVNFGTTWVNLQTSNSVFDGERFQSFGAWLSQIMLNQDVNILDKVTLMWHNHLPIDTAAVSFPIYLYRNYLMLRNNALGNFKTLIRNSTLDAAMMRYLNGYLNNKNNPDENYARELLELFTVGKGSNSNYTEDDVKAAAKVLTGWQINSTNGIVYFNLSRHDISNKSFSSFFNNTVITGRNTATAGDEELDDLLNMIFNQEETSKYICREFYKWFVYYDIDETIETNIITPLAQIFRDNNYEIAPVLKVLLQSEHFFDSLNYGVMIKSPIDFTIGTLRNFNIHLPRTSFDVEYAFLETISSYNLVLQQMPYMMPNVSGWPAYYQEPTYYRNWINTSTIPWRKKLIDGLNYIPGIPPFDNNYSGNYINIEPVNFVLQFDHPEDPVLLIDDLINFLLTNDISNDQKNYMRVSILLSGQSSNYYWTQIWNIFRANPNDTNAKNYVYYKLYQLLNYLCNLAEYQLM
jgi:hypothetical protein